MRVFVLLLLALGAVAQTPKTAPKQPVAPAKKATAPAKKTTTPAKKTTAKRTTTAKKRVVRPRTQQKPTPERYNEIQVALIGRGFLEGPADGKWGDDSVVALKKFQESQKLAVTGKIDSLSLIRLGLGPKTTAGLPPSEP